MSYNTFHHSLLKTPADSWNNNCESDFDFFWFRYPERDIIVSRKSLHSLAAPASNLEGTVNAGPVSGDCNREYNHQSGIREHSHSRPHTTIRILYVTRHFNHSGYKILNSLIQYKVNIAAVVLKDNFSWHNLPVFRHLVRFLYLLECRYYRCRPLKNTKSEELLARKSGLPVIKCRTMKSESFLQKLKELNPDLVVLGGGWHELVPDNVFKYPPLGCINTHPSLLPLFRGTSITRWQLLHGVKESGSTIHFVDGTFDTGKIIMQDSIKVLDNETPQELFEKLGDLGARQMPQVLQWLEEKTVRCETVGKSQNHVGQYYPKWKWDKESLRIDWSRPLTELHHFIQANTQESFRYIGPYFSTADAYYLLRETSLQSTPNLLINKEIVASQQPNGNFLVSRKGETVSLVLKRIQRYDRYFRYRRSYRPGQLIRPESICFTGDTL
ncbi:MAG: methionyl-tRNA formyltransferase [Desulfomonilia bacterium]